jgi:hypothetical protein
MNSETSKSRKQLNRTHTLLITVALFALGTSVLASALPVHAQDPDFSISSTPTGSCINLGATTAYSITVSSLGGFQGTVQLDDSIDPNVANGPALSAIPSSVSVTPVQSATFVLTASTSQSTPNQVYAITINGLSGVTVHSVTVYLSFQPLCGAAGGTVEPVNMIGVLAPIAGIAIAILGVAAATTTLLYSRRRKSD